MQSVGFIESMSDETEVIEAATVIADTLDEASNELHIQPQQGQHSFAPSNSSNGPITQRDGNQWASEKQLQLQVSARAGSPAVDTGMLGPLLTSSSSSSSMVHHCMAYSSAVLSDGEDPDLLTIAAAVATIANGDGVVMTVGPDNAVADSDSSDDVVDMVLDEITVLIKATAAAVDAGGAVPVGVSSVWHVCRCCYHKPFCCCSSLRQMSNKISTSTIGSNVTECSDVAEWTFSAAAAAAAVAAAAVAASASAASLIICLPLATVPWMS